jgi:hypothetical protein
MRWRHLLAAVVAIGLLFGLIPHVAGAAVLVHHWKADGDFTDSVAQNNGQGVGNTTFGPGHSGEAFSFDGDDDYVSVPDAASHHFEGSFSVDAWARTTATGTHAIATYYDCALSCPSNPSYYTLGITAGRAYGIVRDGQATGDDLGQDISGGPDIADGTFHHLALVRDVEAGTLSVYVDGALAAEEALEEQADGAITSADAEADPLTIGVQF